MKVLVPKATPPKKIRKKCKISTVRLAVQWLKRLLFQWKA